MASPHRGLSKHQSSNRTYRFLTYNINSEYLPSNRSVVCISYVHPVIYLCESRWMIQPRLTAPSVDVPRLVLQRVIIIYVNRNFIEIHTSPKSVDTTLDCLSTTRILLLYVSATNNLPSFRICTAIGCWNFATSLVPSSSPVKNIIMTCHMMTSSLTPSEEVYGVDGVAPRQCTRTILYKVNRPHRTTLWISHIYHLSFFIYGESWFFDEFSTKFLWKFWCLQRDTWRLGPVGSGYFDFIVETAFLSWPTKFLRNSAWNIMGPYLPEY